MHYNVYIYMLVYVNFLVAKRQIQSGEAGGKKRKMKLPFDGKAALPPCACGAHCMAQAPCTMHCTRMRRCANEARALGFVDS